LLEFVITRNAELHCCAIPCDEFADDKTAPYFREPSSFDFTESLPPYMRMPPGYRKLNTVVRLNKVLYGLRRSPILWQTKFTGVLRNMGFTEVPQESCVMKRGGIICFFYVDDIVFAYRKKDSEAVTEAVDRMQNHFRLNPIGELKWFLEMHIFRDRLKRSLWLSQQAYIEKLANKFIIELKSDKWPLTPMAEEELFPLPTEDEVLETDQTRYQRKIGSILYAAISTRPDIAFAAARLSRYNCRPGKTHQEAVDRMIQYLYKTQYGYIQFGHESTAGFLTIRNKPYGHKPYGHNHMTIRK
jgi:hypothetical protein